MPEKKLSNAELDRLTTRVAEMNRPELIQGLESLSCRFEMDFTEDYLASISLERLRHIFLAACLRADGNMKPLKALLGAEPPCEPLPDRHRS